MKTIKIFHTNDIHSNFDAFCKIGTVLEQRFHAEHDLLLDAGDFCDAKSIMISGTQSTGGIALLKMAGYDAMAVGNNEFFQGTEVLQKMASIQFPLLAANLSDLQHHPLPAIHPFLHLQKNGVQILLIGLCPYFANPTFTDMAGVCTFPANEIVQQIVEQEKGTDEIVVVLSHLGYQRDVQLAEMVSGLTCIIGGHSHTLMEAEQCVNGCVIHQSGKYGTHLGEVTLVLDENNHLIHVESQQIDCSQEEEHEGLKSLLQEQEEIAIQNLSQVLYELDHDLHFDPYHPCEAMTIFCDILYHNYKSDFAMMHHGILNGDISRCVSKMSLLELCPSPLNPTLVKWSGKQIREALYASHDEKRIHTSGFGPGFRGTCLGTLSCSSNVTMDGEKIFINGSQLQETAIYEVITDDYLQRGTGYEMLRIDETEAVFYDGFFREILEKYLRVENSETNVY